MFTDIFNYFLLFFQINVPFFLLFLSCFSKSYVVTVGMFPLYLDLYLLSVKLIAIVIIIVIV